MVSLGDKVKDTISGFEGIAVAMHSYLQGCERITIQPEVGKDGKLPETQTFDEPLLKVIKEKQVSMVGDYLGGPEKYSDISRGNY